jgi:hypothetical protein
LFDTFQNSFPLTVVWCLHGDSSKILSQRVVNWTQLQKQKGWDSSEN